MNEKSHSDIWEEIGQMEARLTNVEKKIDRIDSNVMDLRTFADMGKGAWWMILKIGAVLTVIAGMIAWFWKVFK